MCDIMNVNACDADAKVKLFLRRSHTLNWKMFFRYLSHLQAYYKAAKSFDQKSGCRKTKKRTRAVFA